MGLSDATREQLLTPLERGIADAMLRREQGGSSDIDEPDDGSDIDEPGADELATDEPGTGDVTARAVAATLADPGAAPAHHDVIA